MFPFSMDSSSMLRSNTRGVKEIDYDNEIRRGHFRDRDIREYERIRTLRGLNQLQNAQHEHDIAMAGYTSRFQDSMMSGRRNQYPAGFVERLALENRKVQMAPVFQQMVRNAGDRIDESNYKMSGVESLLLKRLMFNQDMINHSRGFIR